MSLHWSKDTYFVQLQSENHSSGEEYSPGKDQDCQSESSSGQDEILSEDVGTDDQPSAKEKGMIDRSPGMATIYYNYANTCFIFFYFILIICEYTSIHMVKIFPWYSIWDILRGPHKSCLHNCSRDRPQRHLRSQRKELN